MIRKSIKYFIIALCNLVTLSILLAIWTDSTELTFNEWIRPIEFVKILGISILVIIGMGLSILFYRKLKVNSIKKRIRLSILLTLLISSFFYFDYTKRIYQNRIINREIRESINQKMESTDYLTFGTKADNLTFDEYREITKINWFPEIPNESDSISYYYSHDGFLPDYVFQVSYNLPLNIKIDTITTLDGDFYKSIKTEIIGNKHRVTQYEYLK